MGPDQLLRANGTYERGRPQSPFAEAAIMGLLDRLKAFFRLDGLPPAPRRLDGRSKTLLAASFNVLPDEEPGWITMKEAATLFSPERDTYAFGELDEIGKANLAAFAAASGEVQFEFMPVEGRLYFMRKRVQRRSWSP
jgi:hypothetical protein